MSRHKRTSTEIKANPTRRDVLKILSSGALAGAIHSRSARIVHAADPGAPQALRITPNAPSVLAPFPLTDVRLLEGPFLAAQKRNEEYLLKLEADRMLHNFRVNAGLQAKADIYGGWESARTWADIRCHGHTLGHYLTAASLMYASTGHAEPKQRIDYILGELKECQDAAKTGLICAFPDNDAQIQNMVQGRRSTGVPWYTLHKIMAGLRDAHLVAGSDLAKEILVRLTDWAANVTHDMTDDQFQRMLRTEHGGMNEVVADVYALTNNEKHLALAERFCHKQVLEPLAEGRDILNGLHSNTQIPKFIGFERLYQLTGNNQYHAAAEFFWKTVTTTRTFATGGNGDGEHFFPVNQFEAKIPSAKTMETCCTHNMLRLTRMLFGRDPRTAYADYYERALFNAILGSQDPDTGMVTYFQSTRPGYLKLFCTPFDSFWCCTGTGIENHAKYGDSIYFHGTQDGAHKNALFVNLSIASTLNWKDKGVSVKLTTSFPETGKVRLDVTAAAPQKFTLNLRHPAWAASAMVLVNGSRQAISSNPGSYIALDREWKSGDVVELDLPMALHAEPLPGAPDIAAIVYGPIVLVGALGHEVKQGEDLIINERNIGNPHNEHIDVPTLSSDLATLSAKVKPAGAPLTFKTDGVGTPNDVTLVPYFRTAHQHYNMYWNIQPS